MFASPKTKINLNENNCVLLLIYPCQNSTVCDGFDSVYCMRKNHAKLDVIKLTVIWFHCQRYGAMSELVNVSLWTWNALPISFLNCSLLSANFVVFFFIRDKQSSGCSSLTQKIYDHIVNIDQLIVTTSTYRFEFPAIQRSNRAFCSRFRYGLNLLWSRRIPFNARHQSTFCFANNSAI